MFKYIENLKTYEEEQHQIESIKTRYEAQREKIKEEQYVADLIFRDLVSHTKSLKSVYDYMFNQIEDACLEVNEKLKKNRKNINFVEESIQRDFFDENFNIKITEIIPCGYETYAWRIVCKHDKTNYYLEIPVKDNITQLNFNYALDGKFGFGICSPSCYTLWCSAYTVEGLAKEIQEKLSQKTISV